MHKIQRKTHATEAPFKRAVVFIPATLLQDRLQQIDYSLNFAQLLKTLFKEHVPLAVSAPSKGFVQILANFNKSSLFFPM